MIFLRSHQTLTLQCRQSAHPLVMDSSGCPREQNTLVTVMQGGFPRSTGKQEVPVASFLPSAQGPPSCGQTSPQVSWWSVSRHARRPHCCLAFLPVSGHPRVPRTSASGRADPRPQDPLLRPRDSPFFMKSPLNLNVSLCVGKIMATP